MPARKAAAAREETDKTLSAYGEECVTRGSVVAWPVGFVRVFHELTRRRAGIMSEHSIRLCVG